VVLFIGGEKGAREKEADQLIKEGFADYLIIPATGQVYLWDWSAIADEGIRFENLIAGHLLKMKHLLKDQEGYKIGLHYLRDVSKREVDFLVTADRKPWFAVECRVSAHSTNPSLRYFGERLQIPYLYQVTLKGSDDVPDGWVRIMPAGRFLGALP
jgi:hypothetical protein